MSNLTTFKSAGLPAVTDLALALKNNLNVASEMGVTIIKMDRTGHWVFGADQTEIEDDSTWAVNPFSFVHGYIAWGDGEVLAEKMGSVSQPLPELEAAPPGAKKGWETQVGFSMKCLDGADKDMEVRYTTTSVGGKKAVQALAVAIATQVEKDQSKPVPVVELGKEHYTHKSYGRIYTPVFKVLEWASMDGKSEVEAEEAPAIEASVEAEAAAPARRRRTGA
jgi:hypothetical protein